MTLPAIKVEGLWKEYVVGHAQTRHATFYDLLGAAIKSPFQVLRGWRGPTEDMDKFWALRDVSFEVRAGEVVGIIGCNGAGKSTLLKILSRITAPTKGRIEVCGRLASLLEVGTGFHPELSGRENVYLNGAILGMTRAEITRKFDEIVAFAEIEKFVDTPVKRYSSGMYVRLAFAVAAHLDVDVLIIDEILAVGDAAFQEKCLNKMEDVSHRGKTVLFVSHNLGAVSRLCKRGILLDGGALYFDSEIDSTIMEYTKKLLPLASLDAKQFYGSLSEQLAIFYLSINDSTAVHGKSYFPEQEIKFTVRGKAATAIKSFRVTVVLRHQGHHILSLHDLEHPRDLTEREFESTISVPKFFLGPGNYTVEIKAYSTITNDWLWATQAGSFSIVKKWYPEYDPEHMGLVNYLIYGTRV